MAEALREVNGDDWVPEPLREGEVYHEIKTLDGKKVNMFGKRPMPDYEGGYIYRFLGEKVL